MVEEILREISPPINSLSKKAAYWMVPMGKNDYTDLDVSRRLNVKFRAKVEFYTDFNVSNPQSGRVKLDDNIRGRKHVGYSETKRLRDCPMSFTITEDMVR